MNISHSVTFQGDKGIAAIFYIIPFAILSILIPLFLSYLYRRYVKKITITLANIDIIPFPIESRVVDIFEADDIEYKDASISVLIDENYTDEFVKSVPIHIW
jgi:hypothetical protein